MRKSSAATALDLFNAAATDDADTVGKIIAQGFDVNYPVAPNSKTALHAAAESGSLECAKRLIAAGANVNVNDDWQETPLMKATQEKSTEIFMLLLAHGAKWDTVDCDGNSLLHHAVYGRSADMVKICFQLGVDPKIRNNDLETAEELARSSPHDRLGQMIQRLSETPPPRLDVASLCRPAAPEIPPAGALLRQIERQNPFKFKMKP